LDELPGVGPSTAQKIIDGRSYKKLDDLKNVKGIGDATFDKLESLICL
jgi:competence protein ComEA